VRTSPPEQERAAGAGPASALTAAFALARTGIPAFPVGPDKRPLVATGFHAATMDREQHAAWWRGRDDRGVAYPTGTASNRVVLDVDGEHGERSLEELEQRYGKIPETMTVRTGGGGRHLVFRHPGRPVPCSAGKVGAGLDVRGDGGYVLTPPSPHESGRRYELELDVEPAELPAWLLELVVPETTTGPTASVNATATITAGARNMTLTRLAGAMRRHGVDGELLLETLRAHNSRWCEPPLDDRELATIARSIAEYAPEPIEAFTLVPKTARVLCAQPDPPETDRIVGPILARGERVLIAAETGAGKTTFMQRVVQAATEGGELLDWEARGGARVLILDLEQGLKSVKRGLREAGLDNSELVQVVRVPDGLALDADETHISAFEELLGADDWDVVVIDPFYKAHAGDSNDERQTVDLMRRLDGWREQHGFGLILTSHLRKPAAGAKFTLAEVFGSSALTRGAEVVLGLRRLAPGYARIYFLKDRDGDLPVGESWGLLFDREAGYRRDPNDGKKPKAANRIRELLEEEADLGVEQLAAAAKVSDRTVRRVLKELEAEKQSELELQEPA
jgi:hypothetical protein